MNHELGRVEMMGYYAFAAIVLICIYGYAAVLFFIDLVMFRPTQKTLAPRSATPEHAQLSSPPEAATSH